MTMSKQRIAIILGSADGVTLAVSIMASLTGNQTAIWHAGLGDGLGELVGMFAALYLSSSDDKTGFWPAVSCGLATLVACTLPCVPFIFTRGILAFALAALLVILVGAAISRLRPEKGVKAVLITYGVIIGAGLLAWAGSYT
jgi:hypothetical protein